jgi:hypothetical protein
MPAVCLRQQCVAFAGDAFSDLVDAPHRAQNPDFLSDSDATICTDIAHECWHRAGGCRGWCRAAKGVGFIRAESGAGIMCVNPLAFGDIFGGDSERLTVFDDRRSGLDWVQGDFMSAHHA